jgi:hypothetical protein
MKTLHGLFLSATLALTSAFSAFGHETGYPHMHFFSDPDNPAGVLPLILLAVSGGIVTGLGIFLYDYRRKTRRNSREVKKDRSEIE